MLAGFGNGATQRCTNSMEEQYYLFEKYQNNPKLRQHVAEIL